MPPAEPYSHIIERGPDERLYPPNEIALIVEALGDAGISPADALRNVDLSWDALFSPDTRVSLNQVLRCCRNALRLSPDPFFAYRVGLRAHISTYGMYGFGILSSTSFRQAFDFAIKYRALLTPIVATEFREDGRHGIWSFQPIAHPAVDESLYRFLVEFSFGVVLAVLREIMGQQFAAEELRVAYQPTYPPSTYRQTFECAVIFGQGANELVFDAKWMKVRPVPGDKIAHASVVALCERLLLEMQLRSGMAGRVRRALSGNLARHTSLESLARVLKTSPRTLRRELCEQKTSFRDIVDELRAEAAIRYLRDTRWTAGRVADALGFSDEVHFRRAFRRWTKAQRRSRRNGTAHPHGPDRAGSREGSYGRLLVSRPQSSGMQPLAAGSVRVPLPSPSPDNCRMAVDRVTTSEVFAAAPQLAAFLRFVAEAALSGRTATIKAYTVAVGALGRPADFDPITDPIVRVEAVRLRALLNRYYASAGASDALVITLPPGRYVPQFRWRSAAASRSKGPSADRGGAAMLPHQIVFSGSMSIPMRHRREIAEVSRHSTVLKRRLAALRVTVDEMGELIASMSGSRNMTVLRQKLVTLQARVDGLRELIAGVPGSRPKALRRPPQIGGT